MPNLPAPQLSGLAVAGCFLTGYLIIDVRMAVLLFSFYFSLLFFFTPTEGKVSIALLQAHDDLGTQDFDRDVDEPTTVKAPVIFVGGALKSLDSGDPWETRESGPEPRHRALLGLVPLITHWVQTQHPECQSR